MRVNLKIRINSYLDNTDSLNLQPEVEVVEKKKGGAFSIACSTKQTRYYSSNINWFKDNNALPTTVSVIRDLDLLRLNFASLKEEDTGTYKCNITDDQKIEEVKFKLIVLGKLTQFHLVQKEERILWIPTKVLRNKFIHIYDIFFNKKRLS